MRNKYEQFMDEGSLVVLDGTVLDPMQVYEDFIHRYVGTVEEVLTYPAHKLYKVRGPEKCYLIPAVQDIFIVDIDAEKREIYVKMIEGLETNAD